MGIFNLNVGLQGVCIGFALVQQISDPLVNAHVLRLQLHIRMEVLKSIIGLTHEK